MNGAQECAARFVMEQSALDVSLLYGDAVFSACFVEPRRHDAWIQGICEE
jgi:hypothetical protein